MKFRKISAILLIAALLTGCAGKNAGSIAQSEASSEEASASVSLSEVEGEEKTRSENSVVSGDEVQVSEKVEKILQEMTLEEKIAQMIMPSVRNEDNESAAPLTTLTANAKSAVQKYGFGGYIFFAPNCEDTYKLAKLTQEMQRAACSEDSEVQLPLLMAVDQEGGIVSRLKEGTSTPGNMALAASGDTKMALETGDIIGSELAAVGLNVDFAPVMDVNSNPENPIIGLRSFSDDAETAAKYGTEFIKGIEQNEVSTALKHFPGHGDTDTDSHTGLPRIEKTEEELEKNELIPFEAGIAAGTDMIMTAHIQFPEIETEEYVSKSTGEKINIPATLSHKILTELLREKMGYKGIIVTDSMVMDAIKDHFGDMDAARLAINAGADILLMPGNIATSTGVDYLDKYIKDIAEMVEKGEIAEDRINASVSRILALKEEKGMLDEVESYRDLTDKEISSFAEEARKIVGSDEHKEKEEMIAEAAITLITPQREVSADYAVSSNSAVSADEAVSGNDTASGNSTVSAGGTVSDDYIVTGGKTVVLAPDSDILEGAKVSEIKADYGLYDKSIAGYDNVVIISVLKASKDETDKVCRLIDSAKAKGAKCLVISAGLPYDAEKYESADGIYVCYGYVKRLPNIRAALRAVYGEFTPGGVMPVKLK